MPDENWLTDPEQVSAFDITVPDLPVLRRWPPVQQNFRRRENLPMWVSILLIFLAIALIGGGLGLILFGTTVPYRGRLPAHATAIGPATVRVRHTAHAQDPATANPFAAAHTQIYCRRNAPADSTSTSTA